MGAEVFFRQKYSRRNGSTILGTDSKIRAKMAIPGILIVSSIAPPQTKSGSYPAAIVDISDPAVVVILPLLEVELVAPAFIENVEDRRNCDEQRSHDREEHIQNIVGSDIIFFFAHKNSFRL